jgi:signal transduction histidine kinase
VTLRLRWPSAAGDHRRAPGSLYLPATILAVLAPIGIGLVADRTLARQARTDRERAGTQAIEDARLATLSVRAILAQLEANLREGGTDAEVASWRIAIPPVLHFDEASPGAYSRRTPQTLLELASSRGVTPTGLPEAVVAALALDDQRILQQVRERFLSGRLPVRADDVDGLARRLGVSSDPRVKELLNRLRQVPPAEELPEFPKADRRLHDGLLLGIFRDGADVLSYTLAIDELLRRAAVPPATSSDPAGVAVPGVNGLGLVVRPDTKDLLVGHGLRALLWLAVISTVTGLVATLRGVDRARRALDRERTFLASVGHELRTPLASVRLLGETLAEGRGEAIEYGRLLAEESERLERMVEQVLAATRVAARPSFAVVDPSQLLTSAAELVRLKADRHRVRLEPEIPEALGEARWDEGAVRRAVVNLLDNAVVHGGAGGTVRLQAILECDDVRVSVTDDGPGIARGLRRRVFERFGRGETSAPGTGLGLWLVEQTATAHGGRVDLEDRPGRGAVFHLRLPLTPPGSEGSP